MCIGIRRNLNPRRDQRQILHKTSGKNGGGAAWEGEAAALNIFGAFGGDWSLKMARERRDARILADLSGLPRIAFGFSVSPAEAAGVLIAVGSKQTALDATPLCKVIRYNPLQSDEIRVSLLCQTAFNNRPRSPLA